jgi:hypothetical protein
VGGGSGNGPASRDSLNSNFQKARDQFPTSPGGYFGTGRSGGKTRQIQSRDPLGTAKKTFKMLSKGGKVAQLPKPGAMTSVFKDGSRVNFRPASSSDGSPVIEIAFPKPTSGVPATQKIHFVEVK